jgi:hypothetical protein
MNNNTAGRQIRWFHIIDKDAMDFCLTVLATIALCQYG